MRSLSIILNQHSHELFLLAPGLVSVIFTLFCGLLQVSLRLFLICCPRRLNIQVILQFSLALLYKNCTPYFLAKAQPQAFDTCLSESGTSDLLPTTILEMLSGWFQLICFIQFSKLLKVFRSLTAYTSTTPAAPLQQVSVMVLNLYWPAVSQICILILTPSMGIVFILKSTPMVVMWVILYY